MLVLTLLVKLHMSISKQYQTTVHTKKAWQCEVISPYYTMTHIQLLPLYLAQDMSSSLFASHTSPVPPFSPSHTQHLLLWTQSSLAQDLQIGLHVVGVLQILEGFVHSLTATFYAMLHSVPLPPVQEKITIVCALFQTVKMWKLF